eukprot:2940179-Alexandrium_andersonii.AAC.1
MSASLVGSEMCIRDRRRTGETGNTVNRSEGLRGGIGKKGRSERSEARESVSYTHLTLPTICSV